MYYGYTFAHIQLKLLLFYVENVDCILLTRFYMKKFFSSIHIWHISAFNVTILMFLLSFCMFYEYKFAQIQLELLLFYVENVDCILQTRFYMEKFFSSIHIWHISAFNGMILMFLLSFCMFNEVLNYFLIFLRKYKAYIHAKKSIG